MRIHEGLALVGSGHHGFDLSHRCDSHVYLVTGTRSAAVIDTGAGVDVDPLLARIKAAEPSLDRVRTVIVTHAHADHAGGAAKLRAALGAELLASGDVAAILRAGDQEAAGVPVGKRSGSYDAEYWLQATEVDGELADEDVVDLGGVRLCALSVPGHAIGHIAVLASWRDRRDLFTGDALLFGGRIILQDTWDCDLQMQLASLGRLADVEFDGFFPGHYSFSLADGKRHVHEALRRIERGGVPEVI